MGEVRLGNVGKWKHYGARKRKTRTGFEYRQCPNCGAIILGGRNAG